MLVVYAIGILCLLANSIQSSSVLSGSDRLSWNSPLDLLQSVITNEICYDDHGCFSRTAPFGFTMQRPFAIFPDRPEAINTTFFLYTRAMRKVRTVISRSTTVGEWNVNKPTKILVHGFLDGMNRPWWIDVKNAILEVDDVNVIMVDWSQGNGFPYEQASVNTQVVGAEIALLINHLITEHGAQPSDFHIIGHSLGGQTAGHAGERVPGLARITGLDPAGPYFESADPKVHLDPTDALFVDVIHTDGTHNLLLGLGSLQRMGHVDFFPNGGYNQPNCPKTSGKLMHLVLKIGQMNVPGFMETSLCSHLAAVYFFIDTIRHECPYLSYPCANFDEFNAGKCSLQCDETNRQCNRMGYRASSTGGKGDLYLKTQDATAYPFCIYHYQITLESGDEYAQTRGTVSVNLFGSLQNVTVVFDNDENTFKRGSIETRFVPLTTRLGQIYNINVTFKKTTNLISSSWYSSTWKFTKATVLNGDDQQSLSFCPERPALVSGSTLRFASC